MSISLVKGQKTNLDKGLKQFTVGLGWDTNGTSTGSDFDLDASVFILGANKKVVTSGHFVFYNNLKSPDDAVVHTGDNLTGAGDGDDEKVIIDLTKMDASAEEVCVVVTIHEAAARKQNFGQVKNAFIRIVDDAGVEVLKYDLGEDFSIETAVEFGRLYKKDGNWKFEAVGTGMQGGLQDYLTRYQ